MDTKTYLDREISRIYNQMSTLDPTSDEYTKLENNWTKLVNQRLEIEKHEVSAAHEEEQMRVNQQLEIEKHQASVIQVENQMKEDRKDRVGRYITDGCKVIIPLGVSVVMTLLAYTFEAKGVIPTGIGKKWADKLTKY